MILTPTERLLTDLQIRNLLQPDQAAALTNYEC